MAEVDAEHGGTFPNVRVIRSTATAIFCTVGGESALPPRGEVGAPRSRERKEAPRGEG